MQTKFDIFSKNNCVIKTSEEKLFQIDEVLLNDTMIDCFKPEAEFLFEHIKRIKFYYYITEGTKINDVIKTILLFEKNNATKIDFVSLQIITYAHITIDLCSFNDLKNLKELILNTNKIIFE